ncbi:MAG: hypothetical protein IKB32_01810 [Clostridia bacterium]|nr:hypothetical protein [Clostridia bacterium]
MRKTKILSLIVAVAMILGTMTIGVSAAGDLPEAIFERLAPLKLAEADNYTVFPSGDNTVDRPLNVVVKFAAIDTEETVQNSPYKDWITDFNLTFNGLAGDSFVADNCYLAGNYGEYGWWVIPVDGEDVPKGQKVPVMGFMGIELPYSEICTSVKEMTCAIYIDDAVIEDNPNMTVTLDLIIRNPENSDEEIIINSTTYDTDDLLGKELDGSGTEADPYLISNIDDLISFRDSVNAGNNYAGKYVKLNDDIDLSSVDNWTPIGDTTYNNKYAPVDASVVFSGVFDGNNKKISNLKIERILNDAKGADADANLGLFGITGEGAVIKNLTITNVDINTDGRNVGALAGVAHKTVLENITINGNIQIKGGNNVSGVCAMSRYYDMSATNITVSGAAGSTITGGNIVGGIFAEIAPNGSTQIFENLSVENIAINGVGGVGGIVGLLTNGAVSNVSVKNVKLVGKTTWKENEGRIRIGSVAGLLGGNNATISGVTVENVSAKNLESEDVVLPVIGANYDASSNATEAKVGDTHYARLSNAIAKAAAGDTITLLSDVSLADGLVIDKEDVITLDLNGKTISRNTAETISTAAITNYGILTIKDSGENGKITAFAQNPDTAEIPYYASNTITNCGVLNIEGGTIENSTDDAARAAFPIDNNSTTNDAIVNITGGTVTGRGSIRQFANSTTKKNEVNIKGGTVAGTSYGIWMQNPGSNNPVASLHITAGTVAKVWLSPSAEFDVAISGGNISTVAIWETDTANAERNPSGFITGGTFNEAIAEEYIAEGFNLVSNSDGTYGVKEDTPWTTATDAGFYKENGVVKGLMRYLFHFGGVGTIDKAGIKFIRGDKISEDMDNFVGKVEGNAKTFYGDINKIPENTEGKYYAVGFVTIGEKNYWSNPIFCEPNFTRHFSTYTGGAE